MNNLRRKAIKSCVNELESVKYKIEEILSDEEYSFDNMPENLQGSIRGEISQEAMEVLNEAVSGLDECIESLKEIC